MARVRLSAAVLLASSIALTPAAIADDAFTRTGVFRALVADDFAAAKSRNIYALETDEGDVLPLRFAVPPAPSASS